MKKLLFLLFALIIVYQKDHDAMSDFYTVSTSLNAGQLYVLRVGNETAKFIGK